MMVKFIRSKWRKYSRLGRGKKKKQVWRKPRGRDNKMREKRGGKPVIVSIGYGRKKSERKSIRAINSLGDIKKIMKNEVVVIGNLGKKKKIEIANELKKMKISVGNINVDKFLKKEKLKEGKKTENKNKIRSEMQTSKHKSEEEKK